MEVVNFRGLDSEYAAVEIWNRYIKSFGGNLWRNFWVIYCDLKIIKNAFGHKTGIQEEILQFGIEKDSQWTTDITHSGWARPEDFAFVVTIRFDWKNSRATIKMGRYKYDHRIWQDDCSI